MESVPPRMTNKSEQSDSAILTQQIEALFAEINAQIIAGAVVLTLLCLFTWKFVPAWYWSPALLIVYVVTALRFFQVWQFHRYRELRTDARWGQLQTVLSGVAGAAWGVCFILMLPLLPMEYQIMILAVSAVSAASSTAEGSAYPWPSRAFVLLLMIPLTIWLATVGDQFHTVLFLLMLIFLPMTLWQGARRHEVFINMVKLRLQNERLAKDLELQRDLVEQASAAKTRFLASASHDLRQPLSALTLFLELLHSDQQLAPRSRDILERAQQASDSLSSLLDALLDISKLDALITQPNRSVFAIQLLFRELESEFMQLAERQNIRLTFVQSSALVDSDPILLGQILRNLITNALRYTRQGRILVGCHRRNGQLNIEVHDTGIGIPADQQQAIFTEFYQVANKERDRQKGLGLGLAIVKRTAQLLAHEIGLRSTEGKGSCFFVTVPLANESMNRYPPRPEPALPAFNAYGKLVVVIENEVEIRIAMHNLLQDWGCQVVSADSIEEAIPLLERIDTPISAILTDYGLAEDFNGIDAINALRQRYGAALPALIITGDTTRETYEAARQAQLPVLYKPVNTNVLRSTLGSIMQPEYGASSKAYCPVCDA
jgi:signal transduction histidine kinase/CheY-like chemotaxis protein